MTGAVRAQAVYVISVAAELAGVHPQTLRIYERKGLVDPARTGGGSRRYSEADIERLRRIQELTNEGLNLAGVKRVLELEAEVGRSAGSASQPSWPMAEQSGASTRSLGDGRSGPHAAPAPVTGATSAPGWLPLRPW